ncbi:MAG: hypothetical protein HC871_11670 [Rhizobiales bacterium]|nr:hypothetical protein [Hyphomicrobiales bacterium]
MVTGENEAHVARVLEDIRAKAGIEALDLPLEEAFHIDLGFPLRWT